MDSPVFSVNHDISPLIYGLSMGYFAWIVPFYHVFSIRIWLGKRLRDLLTIETEAINQLEVMLRTLTMHLRSVNWNGQSPVGWTSQ